MKLTLYYAPIACSLVPLVTLHESGAEFDVKPISLKNKQQHDADYLRINPKGKVPVLVVDGEALTENVAILTWLSVRFPDAHLLPEVENSFAKAHQIEDLAFCASGLHPLVTRLRIPQFFCDTPEGATRVFEMAEVAMRPNFALIDQRLASNHWWYGERWSI